MDTPATAPAPHPGMASSGMPGVASGPTRVSLAEVGGVLFSPEAMAQAAAVEKAAPGQMDPALAMLARARGLTALSKQIKPDRETVNEIMDLNALKAAVKLGEILDGTHGEEPKALGAIVKACDSVLSRARIGLAAQREVRVSHEVKVDADKFRKMLGRRERVLEVAGGVSEAGVSEAEPVARGAEAVAV